MVWTLLLSTLLMSVAIRGQRVPWMEACSGDIVFIVDDSSSIPSAEFDFAKQYITDFLHCFSPEQEIGIGVTLFNCAPRTGIPLGTYTTSNPAGLPAAVSQLVQEGGLSKIGLAIRFMADTSDFHAGVSRVAVLLTDGWAQDDVNGQATDDYEAQAEAARNAGIDLYAVGLGPKSSVAIDVLETIAGSADRVFGSDNPCKVAYRILANLCAAAATDGCLYNGVLIPVGEEWKPDDCTWCTCPAAGEDPVCAVQDCAPPPCADPVKIAGQCCRVCDPPPGCLDIAIDNGAIIPVGEVYTTPDGCTWCRCDADGAEPMCAAYGCRLDPGCTNHVRIAGQCCPTCPACCHGCQHGDVIIPLGAAYQPDPCTFCICDPDGGPARCTAIPCFPPPCANAVTTPGQCCPTCPDGDDVPVMPPIGDDGPGVPPMGDDGPVMPPMGDDGPVMPPMGDDGPPYQPPRVMPPDMPHILGR